jgi:hypothetical protein
MVPSGRCPMKYMNRISGSADRILINSSFTRMYSGETTSVGLPVSAST